MSSFQIISAVGTSFCQGSLFLVLHHKTKIIDKNTSMNVIIIGVLYYIIV